MTPDIANEVAYLRTTRSFPEDTKKLSLELNKSYLDTASAINTRIIGIFPVNLAAITGEAWFFTSQKQQTLRQVYAFTATTDIPIGFKLENIDGFTRNWGEYTDIDPATGIGVGWYGLIHATSVAIPGQITFYVAIDNTSTDTDLIKFVVGAGAPALTSGRIVLEWLSFTTGPVRK